MTETEKKLQIIKDEANARDDDAEWIDDIFLYMFGDSGNDVLENY